MNRIRTAISSAVLATSMAGGLVLAGDQADKQPTAGPQAGQQSENLGAGPNVREMDSNAQRAHSPTGQTGATTDGDRMGAGAPSVGDLDAAAQRAHDPQGGARAEGAPAGSNAAGTDAGANAAAQGGAGGTAGADANVASSGETRDWSAVDANSDNLISPDEMEAALQERGPQAGQQR